MRNVRQVPHIISCRNLGILNSSFHSIDITGRDYWQYKFIIGLDLEKVLGSGFTGITTKAGVRLTIKTTCGISDTRYNASKMHTVLHADCILNITDSGVTLDEYILEYYNKYWVHNYLHQVVQCYLHKWLA